MRNFGTFQEGSALRVEKIVSTRVANCLNDAGYVNSDILRTATPEELRRVHGIGEVGLEEIRTRLQDIGFSLSEPSVGRRERLLKIFLDPHSIHVMCLCTEAGCKILEYFQILQLQMHRIHTYGDFAQYSKNELTKLRAIYAPDELILTPRVLDQLAKTLNALGVKLE